MKIIILEGIATSGKSSVKNELVKILSSRGLDFLIIGEDETLMPILENTDKHTSLSLLQEVIGKVLNEKKDFIIFDRLFFTHIFRTHSVMEDYRMIEKMLMDEALLVFLKIDEAIIPERIANAQKHREKSWGEYVQKKGTTDEINQYYINQQRTLLKLLEQTQLPYKIYDTTNMEFDSIAEDVIKQCS